MAALTANQFIAQEVIAARADVSAQDLFGQTPLHYATLARDIATTKHLLDAGADALAVDETPLVVALDSCDVRCHLLNSCWHRLREADVLQLILVEVCCYLRGVGLRQLRELSRPLSRQARLYYGSPDAQGGSAGQDCKKQKLETVAHNRLVAKKIRSLKQIGELVAPVTTALDMATHISLQQFGLQDFLPPHVRCSFVQRSIMPQKPTCWPSVAPQVIDHLCFLNRRPRDCHISFDAGNHVYFWDCSKVDISTTGLVHSFSAGFDAQSVIRKMRSGSNWPRPGYLQPQPTPSSLLQALKELGYCQDLLSLLAERRCEETICRHVKALARQHPADEEILAMVSLSDAQIQLLWQEKGDNGASQGTWMHTSFECLLNGGFVTTCDEEVLLFKKFLEVMSSQEPGIVVYRTEWMIYADAENFAGSIDLALKCQNGSLVLVDRKRTQTLWAKGESFGKNMRDCLAHIPDCTLWHYRLQLNVYRCILEKYYGCRISSMFIVGCHPDNGSFPYVEPVPILAQEVDAMMASLRAKRSMDACGGSDFMSVVPPKHVSPLPLCLLGLFAGGWKGETAADVLLLQSIFGKPSPASFGKIWIQLDEFCKATRPFSPTLTKFPALFWILPKPFETDTPRLVWCHMLEVCRVFLSLIKDGRVTELESAMIAFFWPEIQANPFLLDIVSTAKSSISRRDRIKRLISALLCLHALSYPSLQTGAAAPAHAPATAAKRMPSCIFYRYSVLHQALTAHRRQADKGTVHMLAETTGWVVHPRMNRFIDRWTQSWKWKWKRRWKLRQALQKLRQPSCQKLQKRSWLTVMMETWFWGTRRLNRLGRFCASDAFFLEQSLRVKSLTAFFSL